MYTTPSTRLGHFGSKSVEFDLRATPCGTNRNSQRFLVKFRFKRFYSTYFLNEKNFNSGLTPKKPKPGPCAAPACPTRSRPTGPQRPLQVRPNAPSPRQGPCRGGTGWGRGWGAHGRARASPTRPPAPGTPPGAHGRSYRQPHRPRSKSHAKTNSPT